MWLGGLLVVAAAQGIGGRENMRRRGEKREKTTDLPQSKSQIKMSFSANKGRGREREGKEEVQKKGAKKKNEGENKGTNSFLYLSFLCDNKVSEAEATETEVVVR